MEAEDNNRMDSPQKDCLTLPFGLDEENVAKFADMAKDFAISKGTCIRSSTCEDARIAIPFSLLPSPFPRKWFNLVKSIQKDINYVLHQISYSPKFLKSCLQNVMKADEFMARIYEIYETVVEEGILQPLSLGLLRSDYLLDTDATGTITGIKQVESNTIATSNSAITPNVREMHEFVLGRLGVQCIDKLPENKAKFTVSHAIVSAWDAYGHSKAIILLIVEDATINICDQRALEFAIYEIDNRIEILRCRFSELRENLTLGEGNRLFVYGKEVALVYYRSGYIPSHYKPEDWHTRLQIERSLAMKCPTAGYHLAGTKRVQLELAKPGVLEKFLPENSDAQKIRQVFAGQFLLDGEEGDKSVNLALKNPHKYVLKPEREGGGNNIYGDDIKVVLQSMTREARQAFILMEKINPPQVTNCVVRNSCPPKMAKMVCELGIYGVIIGRSDKVYANYEAGHIIKGKEFGSNEGGIVAGFGVVDSPFLV